VDIVFCSSQSNNGSLATQPKLGVEDEGSYSGFVFSWGARDVFAGLAGVFYDAEDLEGKVVGVRGEREGFLVFGHGFGWRNWLSVIRRSIRKNSSSRRIRCRK